MMDWLRELANDPRKAISGQVARFQNRDFLDAVVHACALVACADGTIKPEEKQKMMGFVRTSESLKVFSSSEVIEAFQRAAAKFEFDFLVGKIDALKVIKRLAGNTDAARTLVRVCCLIGASDGDFDEAEKKAVSEICKTLGLEPKEFELPG